MTDSPSPETDYKAPYAPRSLQTAGRQLWKAVCLDWEIEHDSDDLEVLLRACQAADRIEDVRAVLDRDGLTVTDRFDCVKPHPLLDVETKLRGQVASMVSQIQRSHTTFRRLQLAEDRAAVQEEDRNRRRDRRGGGRRLVG